MRGVARMAWFAALAAACAVAAATAATAAAAGPKVRVWTIHYRAHDGARRAAWVMLPAWYRPKHDPPIPLVISPHGRGVSGRVNLRLWGSLPAVGGFAVVSPQGQGRVLELDSWGAPGQVRDLARMPEIVRLTLPWVRIARRRIYAVGGSMGGQETLLLLARHPHLLAGAAVFDAVSDFALQYRDFPHIGCAARCLTRRRNPIGEELQALARREVGGAPSKARRAWRRRSPIAYAKEIARSHVPLELWWSANDAIVLDQAQQSKRLFDALLRLDPRAPVLGFQGYWRHSAEMKASRRLPLALAALGLLPPRDSYLAGTRGLHVLT